MPSTGTTFSTDCVLMAHCDGTDASTTFTDSSDSAKTMTASGNAQIDTAQFKFATGSGLFDGTGDLVSVADSVDWDFGTGDFTVDLWVRYNAVTASMVPIEIGSASGGSGKGLMIKWDVSATPDKYSIFVNEVEVVSFDSTPDTNTWYHLAVTRSGTDLKFFIDGAQSGTTATNSADISGSTEGVVVGSRTGGSGNDFNGWIDEVRIVKGTAVWTSNFTPPSAAYTRATAGGGGRYSSSPLMLGVG